MKQELIELLDTAMRPRSRADAIDRVLGELVIPTGGMKIPTVQRWQDAVSRIAFSHGLVPNTKVTGEEGWSTLAKLQLDLARLSRRVAARRSTAEWWVLLAPLKDPMRLAFSRTTGDEFLSTCHSFALESPRLQTHREFRAALRNPSRVVVTDISDLLSLAATTRQVSVMMRRVAKGQTATFDISRPMPYDKADHEIERAIELYDARIEADIHSGGAALGTLGRIIGSDESTNTTIGWIDIRDQVLLLDHVAPSKVAQHDPYFPILADVDQIIPVANDLPDTLGPLTMAGMSLLDAVWAWLGTLNAIYKDTSGSWSRDGYVVVPRRMLEAKYQAAAAQRFTDPATVLQLDEISAAARTAVLIPMRGHYMVDLIAATGLVGAGASRPNDGHPANVWGISFEREVQAMLEGTSLAPHDRFRNLIGKKVRREGKVFTDIDAVACIDRTLVLINAKSYRDPGLSHSGVRRMRERLEDDAINWREKIDFLSRNPESLGAEGIREWKIEGLIVLPFTPFVHHGVCTERISSGLHFISTANELFRLATPNSPDPEPGQPISALKQGG